MKYLHRFRVIFLVLIGAIVPLYSRGIVMEQSDIELEHYSLYTSPLFVDLFHLSKSRLLALLLLCTALFLFVLLLKREIRIRLNAYIIFPILFLLIIGLSSRFSEYREIVGIGFSERYEGAYVYVYYVMLVVLSAILIQSKDDVLRILWGIMFGSIGIHLIGILQTMDIFPFLSEWARPFVFGLNHEVYQGAVQAFLERNRDFQEGYNFASTSLYNSNYYGVYSTVVFFISLGVFSMSNKKYQRGISLSLVLLNFIGVLISGTKSGFLLLILFMLVEFILLVFEQNRKSIFDFLAILGLAVVVFSLVNVYSKGVVGNLFLNIPMKSLSLISDETDNNEQLGRERHLKFIDIRDEETLVGDGQDVLRLVSKGDRVVVENEELFRERWEIEEVQGLLRLGYEGRYAYFQALKNGQVAALGPKGLVFEVKNTQPLLMNGYFLSSRGYIWSKVIPLILDQPYLGHGADTLTIYHPKEDLVNAFNYTYNTTSISVNPHSMYLLIAFNFGFIGLGVFLTFVLVPLVMNGKKYVLYSHERTYLRSVTIPLLVFLACGVSNDTIVGTGVILYLLIGLAYFQEIS